MQDIAKAIVETMKAIKGVEKNSEVGSGANSYKGVKDQDAKEIVRKAMIDNGLSCLPIGVESHIDTTKWEEKTSYGVKQKQSVFTEVKTKYLLLHTSGQSVELVGYGHGVDSQDKGAGKAMTYALKNTLLYSFLVPTGNIDDTDETHSDAYQVVHDKEKSVTPAMPVEEALAKIAACATADELRNVWTAMPVATKADIEVKALKDELKAKFESK